MDTNPLGGYCIQYAETQSRREYPRSGDIVDRSCRLELVTWLEPDRLHVPMPSAPKSGTSGTRRDSGSESSHVASTSPTRCCPTGNQAAVHLLQRTFHPCSEPSG